MKHIAIGLINERLFVQSTDLMLGIVLSASMFGIVQILSSLH